VSYIHVFVTALAIIVVSVFGVWLAALLYPLWKRSKPKPAKRRWSVPPEYLEEILRLHDRAIKTQGWLDRYLLRKKIFEVMPELPSNVPVELQQGKTFPDYHLEERPCGG